MKKVFLLISILLLSIYLIHGQDYLIKNYGPSDGLKAANVYSYYQDSLGFIWMGLTDGLCCFDGENFKNYAKPLELFNESIRDIDRNFNGNLLLMKKLGDVWEFDGFEFKKYRFNHTILDTAQVTGIQFFDNKLFIGTKFNGLFINDNNKIIHVGNIKNHIIKITEDIHHNLLVINNDGVYEYHDGTFSFMFKHEEFLYSDILKHNNKDHWSVSKNSGVYINRNNQWNKIFGKQNLELLDFAEDTTTVVWLGTYIGLFRIIENLHKEIYTFQEVFDETILKVFVDRSNNVWASTYGKGVYKLTRNKFHNHKFPSSFPGEWGMITLKDNEGGIWISAANYGLIRYFNDRFIHYNIYNDFPPNECYYCGIDLDTCILFGGDNITIKFKNGEFSLFTQEEVPKKWGFWGFLNYSGQLYSILNYSIYKYSDNKWQATNYFNPYENVNYLLADYDNIFWAGTDSGLYKIDNNEIVEFKNGGLSKNIEINTIQESTDSSIWVGADNGLYQIKNNSIIQYFNEEDGLIDNEVTAIKIKDDDIYIGTRVGLSIYSNKKFGNFTTGDGMLSNFIFMPRIEIANSKLFMGAGNGFSILNIGKSYNTKKTNVVLTKIFTDYDTIVFNPLKQIKTDLINFKYNTTFIKFDFDIIDFNNEIKNIRYNLNNNGKVKTIVSNNKEIAFSNLKFGEYKLVLEYQYVLGDWQKGYEQNFCIKIPFYLSKPAFVFYLLIISILAVFYYRKKKRKQNHKYQTSSLSESRYEEIKFLFKKLLIDKKIYSDPDISLSILAKKLNCSKEYISQVINTEYKVNFNTLINQYRIEEAKKLLIDKNGNYNYSILQIAFEVGFNSKSAFNTAFKKHTNYTPTEFRKKYSVY